MKKFMTVLLVIAVMFTFSFGSAFAASANATQVSYLGAAEDYIKTAISKNFDEAFDQAAAAIKTAGKIGTYTVESATVIAEKDNVKAAIDAKVAELTKAQMDSYTATKTVAKELAAEIYPDFVSVDTIAAYIADPAKGGLAIVKVQYEKDYAKAVASYDSIDKSLYVAKYDSRIDAFVAAEKQAMAAKKAELAADADVAAILANINAIKAYPGDDLDTLYIEGFEGQAGYETGLYALTTTATTGFVDKEAVYSSNATDKITTTVDAENAEANAAATAAAVKAEIQKKATAAKTTGNATEKAQADSYVTINNALADAAKITDAATLKTVASKDWKAKVAEIEAFKTWAEKQKAELAADGDTVRSAEAIDKIVAATTIDEYVAIAEVIGHTNSAYPTIAAAKAAIAAMSTEKDAKDLEYAKQVALAKLDEAKEAAEADYYPAEYAKVVAKYDELAAKVNAATTVAKVEEIATATTVVATLRTATETGINKKAAVDGLLNFTTQEPEKSLLQAVSDYVSYTNTGKDAQDATRIIYDEAQAKKIITKIYGESDARTVAARKALAVDAATVAAQLDTVGGLKDAQAAAKEAIKALPATITVADCAAVKAAFDADKDYRAMNGAVAYPEQDVLTADVTALHAAMTKDFNIKIAQVDKNDKAAVKALKAEVDEANKLVATDEMFESKTKFDNTDKLGTMLTNIQDAEKKAITAAVNAIPINVTEADKATVEAARALYDAYVAEYTDPAAGVDARTGLEAELAAIKAAETLLGITVPSGSDIFDDTAAKAFVQDLAIVARSTKLSSGKIKVTVNADVEELLDNGYTVKYKFFASTAKKSGYKSKIEKTTKSFTTSGVKGKTNYWKVTVKVYNAAGELVAKTPLTQCKYACRTL